MLWVSGSGVGVGVGVCAHAEPAPPSASAPTARQAPVSALARRVVRFPPYNRSPSPLTLIWPPDCGQDPLVGDPIAPTRPRSLNICRKVRAPEATGVGTLECEYATSVVRALGAVDRPCRLRPPGFRGGARDDRPDHADRPAGPQVAAA